MTVRILIGDCRERLCELPDESVNCVMTSPPYWGLRDYDTTGQIGREDSFWDFLDVMVGVFAEIKRVLRPDGTAWVNMGDAYANDGKWGGATGGKHADFLHGKASRIGREKRRTGLKPKDLIGQPWRLAFALQADGWWLRRDIIWHKLNPMPESVVDRPTTSHEYLFLITKNGGNAILWHHRDGRWTWKHPSPDFVWRHRKTGEEQQQAIAGDDWTRINLWTGFDYWYDAEAIFEPSSPDSHARAARGRSNHHKFANGGPGNQTIAKGSPSAGRIPGVTPKSAGEDTNIKAKGPFHASTTDLLPMRNKRSVWATTTEPFSEAHFATFPPSLIEPCILAGCPKGGAVLDPFGGAGTTGLVADRLGRDAILIELNPEYAAMAERRIRNDGGMMTDVRVEHSTEAQSGAPA